MKATALSALLTALLLAPLHSREGSFDHSHGAFTEILEEFVVSDNYVDYAALKKDPAALEAYLETLADVPEETFDSWNENRQLAFLINLYNAATLKLIVDHYPVESIKDIGGFFSGPWKQKVVDLFGEKVTLDHVEHEIIRKHYDEPRVHFGLVCAAVGCPPLGTEAFDASRLDTQLDERGKMFFANPAKNRVEDGVLYLSPIFKWFSEDFAKGGTTVAEFVAPYFPEEADREAAASGNLKIKYTDYDWSLNEP
ncbi:MAG: DUF547 domain-containing protein [Verrucomicrobiales bacterium]